MAHAAPEWISTTIVEATLVTDGTHAERVRIKVGEVRMPGGGGVRVGSQVEGRDDELFILPPGSVARIMGALSRGLREL